MAYTISIARVINMNVRGVVFGTTCLGVFLNLMFIVCIFELMLFCFVLFMFWLTLDMEYVQEATRKYFIDKLDLNMTHNSSHQLKWHCLGHGRILLSEYDSVHK